ncbi:hypothetical protein KY284_020753 [Solanum tuberosum]|nr:hypothetical protein KY284_020753 [Solanum tuberosum]
MGDFNAVLRSEDTKGGNQVQDTEVKDFEIMLINTRLNELRFIGRFFTWTNSHVHSKIDRAIFGEDPKPFRFLHHQVEHQDFMTVVETTWAKPGLGKHMEMNKRYSSKVDHRVQDTRKQLMDQQEMLRVCHSDPALFTKEKELKKALEKWIMVEETILGQKSRVQWLKLGDTKII